MARHAKTDSDVTSLAPSSPPRSPRRSAYYVLSPAASHPDVVVASGGAGGGGGGVAAAEKMSFAGSTPAESPLHYHYHHSGAAVHHSRESSTGRLLFSDQLRSGAAAGVPWRRLAQGSGAGSVGDDDDDEGGLAGAASQWRCYALGAFAFVAVFAFFLLVLWGASKSYKPHVVVKSVVFETYHIQGGTDRTGVPTKMMSVNATVRLRFRNRGTFFSLHVTSTPFHLFYDDLTVATGHVRALSTTPTLAFLLVLLPEFAYAILNQQKGDLEWKRNNTQRQAVASLAIGGHGVHMAEFYQPRRSGRVVTVSVVGKQVPLYGAGAELHSKPNNGRLGPAVVPVRMAFVLRARAHILGLLVRSKFYRRVLCRLDVREASLGKPVHGVAADCEYHDGR
uniref:Late embryogenesis abundant protein LEA-2 subgroup domain-containing protein n=1 Tax=Oryza nivara TaxID=4536 RepID=A0A0E0GAX6_ORYNI